MIDSTYGAKIEIVRGPAAATVARWAIASGLLGGLLTIGMFVGMLANDSGYLGSAVLSALMIGAITCGLVLAVAYPWSYVKERKEIELGYTTYPRHRKDLPQVDPRSGRVMRRANEPFLDRGARRARSSELMVLDMSDGNEDTRHSKTS